MQGRRTNHPAPTPTAEQRYRSHRQGDKRDGITSTDANHGTVPTAFSFHPTLSLSVPTFTRLTERKRQKRVLARQETANLPNYRRIIARTPHKNPPHGQQALVDFWMDNTPSDGLGSLSLSLFNLTQGLLGPLILLLKQAYHQKDCLLESQGAVGSMFLVSEVTQTRRWRGARQGRWQPAQPLEASPPLPCPVRCLLVLGRPTQ
jgi:hypothetical protein